MGASEEKSSLNQGDASLLRRASPAYRKARELEKLTKAADHHASGEVLMVNAKAVVDDRQAHKPGRAKGSEERTLLTLVFGDTAVLKPYLTPELAQQLVVSIWESFSYFQKRALFRKLIACEKSAGVANELGEELAAAIDAEESLNAETLDRVGAAYERSMRAWGDGSDE